MGEIDALKEQIEKTETILSESRENFEKNPEEYSAQLLLMSTENHLADLLSLYPLLHDHVAVSVVMPNASLEVNNKHNLEQSTISNAPFAASFLGIILKFQTCLNAPFRSRLLAICTYELHRNKLLLGNWLESHIFDVVMITLLIDRQRQQSLPALVR